MGTSLTPLGYIVPDEDDPVANGENIMAANALTSEALLTAVRARVAQLEGAAGFPGSGVDLADEVITALLDAPTLTRNKMDTRYARLYGERGVTRIIYVRATGNDETGDGATIGTAFREIRTALESLATYITFLSGGVKIDTGAGTYKGGLTFPAVRGAEMDDFIRITGPNISHPTVPTVIVDHAADTSATFGFQALDGVSIWLEDIKFIGGFDNAVDIRRNSYLIWRNIHMDGQGVGTNGLSIQQHARYTVLGGIIENMVDIGVSEHFLVQRSYDGATSTAQQLIIRNCNTGFQAKEGCVGHLDYLTVTDCLTGIEFNGGCVTNLKGVTLMRNQLGIANVNSEVHNTAGIVWGTGADANVEDYKPFYRAVDISEYGWTDGATARAAQAGYPALVTLQASQTDSVKTGPLTETNFYNFVGAIKPRRYTVKGRSFRVQAYGKVGASALVANYRILLRIGGTFVTDLTIPAGTAANTRFRVDFKVTCSTGGNNQKAFAELAGGVMAQNYAIRTLDLTTTEMGAALSAIALNAADEVTLHQCEVWG